MREQVSTTYTTKSPRVPPLIFLGMVSAASIHILGGRFRLELLYMKTITHQGMSMVNYGYFEFLSQAGVAPSSKKINLPDPTKQKMGLHLYWLGHYIS